MNIAVLLGRIVRRLVSPVHTPRGQPVRGQRAAQEEWRPQALELQRRSEQGRGLWDSLSAEQQRAWQRARTDAGIKTCVLDYQRMRCLAHDCDLVERWHAGRNP